ncbi:MAG: hypothetical protein AAGH64_01955 [Planctomycetota bacterium]
MPAAKSEPNPVVQKLVTALFGFGMLALGVYMFINPTALEGEDIDPTSSRKGGLLIRILEFVWGWPGGIVLCLLGLLIVAGLFMKSDDTKGNAPSAEA